MRPHARDIPTLDGWRAVAILLVMIAHGASSFSRATGSAPSDLYDPLGIFGVDIFFALSGFLITTLLIREERSEGQVSLAAFYQRRVVRIMPAASVFLLAIVALVHFGMIDVTPERWLSSLLFVANYSTAQPSFYLGHFWSLAVEEHFYLLWPALFIALSSFGRRLAIPVSLALAESVWRILDWNYKITNDSAAHFFGRTDIQSDALLWGVVVAILYADQNCRPILEKQLSKRWVMALIFAVAIVSALDVADQNIDFLLMSARSIALPFAILSVVIRPTWLGAVLSTRPLKWLGRVSYSVYLWQQLFLTYDLANSPLSYFERWPANLLIVVIVGAASYYLIERPAMALARMDVNFDLKGFLSGFGRPVRPARR